MKPHVESEPRVDKLYYSISEVSDAAEVRPHVLRYWETQFKMLRPQKNRAGNRQYRRKDMNLVLTIRDLLYHQGYTIAGARRKLLEARRSGGVEDGRLVGVSGLIAEHDDTPSYEKTDATPVSRHDGLSGLHALDEEGVAIAAATSEFQEVDEPRQSTAADEPAQLSLTVESRQATVRDVRCELESILTELTRSREPHASSRP